MKRSKHSSPKANPIALKVVTAGWLIFSLVGFWDATYLTIRHYRGSALECAVLEGCEEVTTSQYAVIGGIPLALLGALYYLSVILLTAAYLDTKRTAILKIVSSLTISGFFVSLILVYLQVFVIQALCFYCLISALLSTFLFVFTVISLKTFRR